MKSGTRLGPYEIGSSIGAGGMGEVFRARDTRLNREVAVKVLPRDFVPDVDRLRRFEQEAKTLAALNHPNVLTIHDAGVHEGAPYLVSELLEGRTLRQELGTGALSTRKATDYALQIAQGLAAAHGRGVVHRDLKPDNVFVTKDGRVKILDFGLAKLREVQAPKSEVQGPADPDASTLVQPAAETTEPGRVMGTPSYMSPEQVRGEVVDHRADLFAFGCVLYEMVSGRRPFRRDTSIATMAAIMNDEPPDLTAANPGLPPALARIVHRCLEKLPERRFQTASDLTFALEATREQGGPARDGSPREPGLVWPRWQMAFGIGVLVLLAVGVGWWFVHQPGQTPKPGASSPGATSSPATATATPGTPADKSIAVLPFENMSDDKENTAFFADGMHEDILTHLANIRDLRVISRTSVMDYRGTKKKIPEIARELGVTYILEGSVRRAGRTVRITGQLIRAANDEHLWAKSYDRELTPKEVFSIQAALATEIAGALQTVISPETKKLLDRLPTENLAAYDLYLKARPLFRSRIPDQNKRAPLLQAAVGLDPRFAAAWAELAINHGYVFRDQERTPARLTQADDALARAVRLAPDAPETIMALGWLAYLGHRDWARATAEFEKIVRLQPNNADAIYGLATIQKRQGRWLQSVANHRKALQLDPGSMAIGGDLVSVLCAGRRWDEVLAIVQRVLAVLPEKSELEPLVRDFVVRVTFSATGSTKAADDWLAGLTPAQLESPGVISLRRWRANARGDYAEWQRLDQLGATSTDDDGVRQPQETAEVIAAAFIMAAHGDLDGARLRLGNLPAEVRSKLERGPTNDNLWSEQALMEALLGQKTEALRAARKAVELMPESLDALDGPPCSRTLAVVYAWTGDKDRALAELTRLLRVPFYKNGSVHDLRVDAAFAPLRGDPRFEALFKDPKNSEPLF